MPRSSKGKTLLISRLPSSGRNHSKAALEFELTSLTQAAEAACAKGHRLKRHCAREPRPTVSISYYDVSTDSPHMDFNLGFP